MTIYFPGTGSGQKRGHDVPFASPGIYVPLITAKVAPAKRWTGENIPSLQAQSARMTEKGVASLS